MDGTQEGVSYHQHLVQGVHGPDICNLQDTCVHTGGLEVIYLEQSWNMTNTYQENSLQNILQTACQTACGKSDRLLDKYTEAHGTTCPMPEDTSCFGVQSHGGPALSEL